MTATLSPPAVDDHVVDQVSEMDAGERSPVEVFGIRHHGPGSARSLVAALTDYQPDAVLIEGPADADPLLRWVLSEDMVPPLALLGYAPDHPQTAAFWPYAVFSPEWQAMIYALQRDIDVGFCDLPASSMLGRWQRRALQDDDLGEADDGPAETISGPPLEQHDPLAVLAEAAGYDDPERWWDDLVESRLDSSSPFPMITDAMAELRMIMGQHQGEREARREAYMRQKIRDALKRGRERVAVVCGAWHAPVLRWPLPPAADDLRMLRGAPRRKITLTWVPWTHQRLASATGYGAGVASPGWYHHLWVAADRPIVRWLTKVAQALRQRDLPVSSAHVIEAVRLAETLAGLRGRPLAGLTEVTEATRAVLCNGDELAVRYVTDHLVVGQALGAVNKGVPTVPLEADLARTCRTLRVRREAQLRLHDLDLRRSIDQARSRLFHRLRLLGLRWIVPAESTVQSQGTFRETWESRWEPEYSVAIVEASVWGTTVKSAAMARAERIIEEGSLVELTQAVERCLLADLPQTLDRLLATLADKAALDMDVVHLMDALPALARAQRYGDVRQTDTRALRKVSEVLVVRICAGLRTAVASLDATNAATMRRRIDDVNTAIGLLTESARDVGAMRAKGPGRRNAEPPIQPDLRSRWLDTLATMIDRTDVHGLLLGRMVRLLLDAEQLRDVPIRLQRALSAGVPAADKAAWVDGFFADGALLLIHDAELRELLDDWVCHLDEAEFVDMLPLLRRTFGTFAAAERRGIAERIAGGAEDLGTWRLEEVDDELAAPALATVDLLLGRGHD
ncbi:MAG TPA: DUF5682 family protein [Propionibacteriaceae bacterium]|nr:DUF5682 family protein [Propionibacteriaceae bacterium]